MAAIAKVNSIRPKLLTIGTRPVPAASPGLGSRLESCFLAFPILRYLKDVASD